MTAVVGLDLSLTATGLATPTEVFEINSKGRKGDTLLQRSARLHDLAADVVSEIERHAAHGPGQPTVLVVVEQPAYSRTTGHMHDRSGLWWLVVDELCGSPWARVVEVAPSARARYATGKGNAGKDAVLSSVVRRYPDVPVVTNNEADALVLRAMGCDHLGVPLAVVPAAHRAALEAVAWPGVA